MGDQGDSAGRQRIGFEITERAHAERVVDEAHAARAAHRHARGRSPPHATSSRSPVRRAEQHRRARPDRGGGLQLVDQRAVGDPEQHQVDGLVEIGQRGHARHVTDPVVARVHQVHARRTALRLDDHALAEAVRACALAPTTATDRAPSIAATAARRASSMPVRLGPAAQRRAQPTAPFFLSASAALAACQPGMPHTPPPAWVAELPL